MNFSTKLDNYMKVKDLSREDFAKKLQIGVATVYNNLKLDIPTPKFERALRKYAPDFFEDHSTELQEMPGLYKTSYSKTIDNGAGLRERCEALEREIALLRERLADKDKIISILEAQIKP